MFILKFFPRPPEALAGAAFGPYRVHSMRRISADHAQNLPADKARCVRIARGTTSTEGLQSELRVPRTRCKRSRPLQEDFLQFKAFCNECYMFVVGFLAVSRLSVTVSGV